MAKFCQTARSSSKREREGKCELLLTVSLFYLCSYIDHGNGCLCLRINDAFDIDSGTYSCQVYTTSDESDSTCHECDCSSSGELCVLERDLTQTDAEAVQVLKTPLPVVCASGTEALFYARVYPCDADTEWYLNGKLIEDDSLNMTVRSELKTKT